MQTRPNLKYYNGEVTWECPHCGEDYRSPVSFDKIDGEWEMYFDSWGGECPTCPAEWDFGDVSTLKLFALSELEPNLDEHAYQRKYFGGLG